MMIFRKGLIPACLLVCLMMPAASIAGVSVTSGLTYEKVASAGGTYKGTIQLRNGGDAPQEVKIYQTDYLFYADGRTVYGDPGTDPRSNADWITFAPPRLVIPPKGTAQVDYTMNIPPDETLTGTYWSMLMVEAIAASSPEAAARKKNKISFGISQVMRYGAQMITQIGETGDISVKFAKTELLKEKGKRILQMDLENTGQRWLRPTLWVEFYNEEGVSAGKFDGGKSRIFPGTTARFRVDLSGVPKGKYKALVVADCGGDALFGATYTFSFKEPETP